MKTLSKALLLIALISFSESVTAETRYIRQNDAYQRTIVFIHGVLGDEVETWTNPNTKAFWPEMLMQDKVFDNTNILLIAFPSPKLGNSLSIDELSSKVRQGLEIQKVGNQQELIFLTHSMGGLINRAFLEQNRQYIKKTKLLFFFATPTTGSYAASIAQIVSRNPQFSKMATMTSDSYLADVQRTWLSSPELSSLPSYCAYESQTTFGVKIVDQQSASNLCNRRLEPIDSNHIDIVKPSSPSADSYLAFKAAYLTLNSPSNEALRVEIQDLQQNRDSLIQNPESRGLPLFCDSIRFTLLFGHKQETDSPIRIGRVTANSNSIQEMPVSKGACEIDALSSRPYGIVTTDSYVITSKDDGLYGKFIKDGNIAFPVDTSNILRSSDGLRAISLVKGEAPIGLDILWETKAKSPQSVYFTIDFDQDGPHRMTTTPIVLWR